MTHLLEVLDEKYVPQSEPLEGQVPNSAGGHAWEVNDFTKLRRFLILGTEGGSYYATERDLTKNGLNTIKRTLKADGKRTVDLIVEVSDQGLAAKNDYALFALAVVVANGDTATKRYALDNLNKVARIGTHLFMFCEFLNAQGSLSGRAKRRALARWYTDKDASQVAYQTVKYRNRNNWTHRDVLRIAHPASKVTSGNPTVDVSEDHAAIFDWISGRKTDGIFPPELGIITGFEHAQKATTKRDITEIIREFRLPREAIPNQFLTDPDVWEALLEVGMPLNALIRNLANMTRIGLLTGTSEATQHIVELLSDGEYLQKSRIHPFNVLVALYTYQSGRGFRGTNSWNPVSQIVDALDGAFYKSFKNVVPTGKRIMLAIDISGSMTWSTINNTMITPRDAAAAMALVTAASEKRYEVTAFSTGSYGRRGSYNYSSGITPVDISPRLRLDTVVNKINGMTAGGTDCALPMIWAKDKEREFDAFVVYTDSETWAGQIHPSTALRQYRKASGINDAKLIVVGMVSNNFSIADPKDPGMFDVVGFDTSAPALMSDFIAGRI